MGHKHIALTLLGSIDVFGEGGEPMEGPKQHKDVMTHFGVGMPTHE